MWLDLVIAQGTAAVVGCMTFVVCVPGYLAAGGAMLVTLVLMLFLDAVHPPAVSTTLGFAFRAGSENNLMLFGMAVRKLGQDMRYASAEIKGSCFEPKISPGDVVKSSKVVNLNGRKVWSITLK